jgi:hypothetical protein
VSPTTENPTASGAPATCSTTFDDVQAASPDAYAVEITQHLRDSNLATDEELALIAAYLLS